VLPQPLLELEAWLFDDTGAPPQAEKSEDIGIEGALTGAAGCGFGGAAAVVSAVAQASLEPHASVLLKPDELVGAGAADFGAA